MEPRIQYARTSDGVNIAYWVMGEGLPVIHMPAVPWSHLQAEWRDPEYRHWFEHLASHVRLAKYDNRGSGLSDRRVDDLSWEAFLRDVDAVAGRAGFQRFALVGVSPSSPLALAYAALRPELVTHLILWIAEVATYETGAPQAEALGALLERDWYLYTQTMAHALVAGWSAGDAASRFADLMREAVDADTFREMVEALRRFNASDLLAQIRCPALILHRRELLFPPVDTARSIAARIPNAELAVFEGNAHLPWVGDVQAVVRTVERFLGLAPGEEHAQPPAAPPAKAAAPPALATILFTDVEGSTALTHRLGDARAREVLREHERITREALADYGGSEVKTMGDGFMASFNSAARAVECAIAMQRAFEERSRSAAVPMRVRIGLNAGEPIAEENDLFGTAVIAAARIAAEAGGGEVLVPDVVRQLVAGKGFLFSERGQMVLRGFEEPVRLFEVRWRGDDE